MVEQFANNASSVLSSAIISSDTTLTVVSGTPFSASGTFRIIVESEIMLVTARASNTLTVVRGSEGTIAIAHAGGVTVTQIMTAAAMQQFRQDNIQVGTYSNIPAAGTAGRIYRTTDGNIIFLDGGSSWSPFGPTVPLIQSPPASSFSLLQTGTNGSLVDDAGGLYFSATQRIAAEDSLFAVQNNPGGTGAAYTLTVGHIHTPGGRAGTGGFFSYHITGIGIYNTSTTQAKYLTLYTDATGALRLQLAFKTSLTGGGTATFDLGGYPAITGPMTWFRVQDDGSTNRTWSISNDGRHFKPVTIETRATNMTSQPDKLGIYLNAYNADAQMTVLSYSLTSP